MPDIHQLNSKILCALIAVLFFLQGVMAFRYVIHVDEFFLLDWLHRFHDGNLALPLQTIYLYALGWVRHISINEVTQILGLRALMLGMLGFICIFLYAIARHYFSKGAALFSVFSFLAFAFVFQNATAFRVDIFVTCTLMAALWVFVTRPPSCKAMVITGGLIGLAGMMTIKAVFYAPVFVWIMVMRWAQARWSGAVLWQGVVLGVSSIMSFVLLYGVHSALLPQSESAAGYIGAAVNAGLFTKLFPTASMIMFSMVVSPLYWGMLALGVWECVRRAYCSQGEDKWAALQLSGFIAPLLTLAFYTFTARYYYTFMLAPVSVLLAAGFSVQIFKKNPHFLTIIMLGMVFFAIQVAAACLPSTYHEQKRLLAAIHIMFPEKSPYIDAHKMVSAYPGHGYFMVGYLVDEYIDAGQSEIKTAVEVEKPKFILANTQSLDVANIYASGTEKSKITMADRRALKDNYIHHWGPVYVPGKQLQLAEARAVSVDFIIDGDYTLKSAHPVRINDKTYMPGDVVALKPGENIVWSAHRQAVTLTWGRNLFKPDWQWSGSFVAE